MKLDGQIKIQTGNNQEKDSGLGGYDEGICP